MSKRNSTPSPTIVYFVQQGFHGDIKIGKTTRTIAKRLANLQTGSPKKLHLLGIIEHPLSEWDEASIHKRFAHLRIRPRSEWFSPAKELFDFIEEHTTPPEEILPERDPDAPALPWVSKPTVIAKPIRSRGRPVVADDSAQRALHIQCAGLMLTTNWPVKRIKANFGISHDTVYRWYNLALGYDCPESEVLRKLAATRPKIRR